MNIVDLRKLLLSTVVLIGMSALGFAPQAIAQGDASDATDEEEVIEEIVTTGSRIARAGVDTFYPAVLVSSAELQDGAFTNLADALNQIPAFGVPDAEPFGDQIGQNVGQNFVDFLGLGSQRTLTLVNGRRFLASNSPSIFAVTGGLQVDYNVIPLALVDRIETIGVGGAPRFMAPMPSRARSTSSSRIVSKASRSMPEPVSLVTVMPLSSSFRSLPALTFRMAAVM